MLTLAEQLRAVSVRELARDAGVSTATVQRYRSDPSALDTARYAGPKVRAALARRFPPNGDAEAPTGPDLIEPGSVHEQLARENLELKREGRRKAKRENDIADGLVVPGDVVQSRIGAAANAFRVDAEAWRRDLGNACPAAARDAVLAEFDAGLERMRARVSEALAG